MGAPTTASTPPERRRVLTLVIWACTLGALLMLFSPLVDKLVRILHEGRPVP